MIKSRGIVREARFVHDGVAVRADSFSVMLHIAGCTPKEDELFAREDRSGGR